MRSWLQPRGNTLNMGIFLIATFLWITAAAAVTIATPTTISAAKQQHYRNENGEHDEEDVDETNCINHDEDSFVNGSRQLLENI